MVTLGPGRIGIIRRARDSITPPRARYAALRTALRAYLTDPLRRRSVLDTLGTNLEQRMNDSSLSNFARQDAELSRDALSAFLRMERNLLAGYTFSSAPAKQAPLLIAGVLVSTNLDMLICRERGSRTECGGVLLRLTKADEEESDSAAGKRRDMGAYAATLVQMQVRATAAPDAVVHHSLCMSVDVQSGDVHPSSRNFVSRAQRIEAECRFIAALWNTA